MGRVRRDSHWWRLAHLSPLVRWLHQQTGRGWRHVHREICAMQDGRTLRGRHLREHVRRLVGDRPRPLGAATFFVDRRGILRRAARGRGPD
jgi:hypothetical protein